MSAQGSSGRFSRIIETPISSDSVTGEQAFSLNEHAPRNNLMDYFYFVDAEGILVAAVAGQIEILFSPVEGIFQSVPNGMFAANEATSINWQKPNGFGKAIAVKIKLTDIVGAVGFRANITQSVA
jgi:hypothetical protein